MIRIEDFKSYINNLTSIVEGIDENIIAVTEKHIVKKIKGKKGIILCGIHPLTNSDSDNIDNFKDTSAIMLIILENIELSNVTEDSEIEHYQKLQNIVYDIRNTIKEGKIDCSGIFKSALLQSFIIEPIYSEFGKYNGYSLIFSVNDRIQ